MTTRRFLLGSSLFLAALSQSSGARSEDPWTYEAITYVDRAAADDVDDKRGRKLELQPRFGAGVSATRSFDLPDEQSLAVLMGISTERYPENPDQSRLFFDAGADYTVPIDLGTLRLIRFGLDLRDARDDDNWVYNRARFETAFRFQPAPRNSVQLRGRVGYRDQNDEGTFSGYDQAEYLVDAMHNWRSPDALWRTTSTVYFEHRDADNDIYTYDEIGVRLIGRRVLTEMLTLVGRTSGFVRQYEDDTREDYRFRGTVGVDVSFENDFLLENYVGYQRNQSTREDKDYGGVVFGVARSKTF